MENRENDSHSYADIVAEYLENAIQHILHTRMVYQKSDFMDIQKYSMNLAVLKEHSLKAYIEKNVEKIRDFLALGCLQRVALVIGKINTGEVIERWQFIITESKRVGPSGNTIPDLPHLHNIITQSLKQIGVCFLPPLDSGCSFKILLYTDKTTELSENLLRTHLHGIRNGQDRQVDCMDMRNVLTPRWLVTAAVAYCTV